MDRSNVELKVQCRSFSLEARLIENVEIAL
jgi:hypothetical protein